jgi:hypothetical protein
MSIKYEDIDTMDRDQLVKIVGGDEAGLSLAKLRARVKGMVVVAQEEADAEEDLPEDMQEVETELLNENSDSVTISKKDFDALVARVRAVESLAGARSKAKLKEQRILEQFEASRVSDHYRDVLKEEQAYKSSDYKKRPSPIMVERDRRTEEIAFNKFGSGGRLVPCAPNGGRYWLKNKNWHENPKSGEKRGVIPFNRHLYVKTTIKEGMHRNPDYILCDVYGNEVSPFSASLPMENYDAGIPWKPRRAPKPKLSDLVKELTRDGE